MTILLANYSHLCLSHVALRVPEGIICTLWLGHLLTVEDRDDMWGLAQIGVG